MDKKKTNMVMTAQTRSKWGSGAYWREGRDSAAALGKYSDMVL